MVADKCGDGQQVYLIGAGAIRHWPNTVAGKNLMNSVFKLMNFAFKTMNFAALERPEWLEDSRFQVRDFVLQLIQMMNLEFKMMNFVLK